MAQRISLKYGCNPNQKPASILLEQGELPVEVLNGAPGYINFLDALNAYQLVRELKQALGLPAAASFKHVSPAGAAVGIELGETDRRMFFVNDAELTPLACAYIRARGADRLSSFGDYIALSDPCDEPTARYISPLVSDGIIAPGFAPEAFNILKGKRKGSYNIIRIDPDYSPAPVERRQVFGITFEQGRNDACISTDILKNIVTKNSNLPDSAVRDLILALITLKYTQSNSVCYAQNGQTIGVGAGQQSRIHCTRLAGNKADQWQLRRHERALSLPFLEGVKAADRDNAIDLYLNAEESGDVLDDGKWQRLFRYRPEPLTAQERKAWLGGGPRRIARKRRLLSV